MTDDVERYVVESDVMLDNLIWRRYRRRTPGLVERALALNPGLAKLGIFIPRGTVLSLPIAAAVQPTVRSVVKLWD